MKLLAFDTSASACSVALMLDEKIIARHEVAPMQQAKMILPLISELLQQEKTTLAELDAIAFGCGPGSFTGVRIATSVAQGLAYATGKSLIAISSLAAMAQAAYDQWHWPVILTAADARIQEVYWGLYAVQEDGLVRLIDKEHLTAPERMLEPAGQWAGAGNAWAVYSAQISFQPERVDTECQPDAAAMLRLAKAKYLAGETVLPENAAPVYLRDEVAKKQK